MNLFDAPVTALANMAFEVQPGAAVVEVPEKQGTIVRESDRVKFTLKIAE